MSGRLVEFSFKAVCKCVAKTPTFKRFFAQLKVRMKRSRVDGAIVLR
jgi:hypothetical protein